MLIIYNITTLSFIITYSLLSIETCSLPDIQNGAWESRIESTPNTRIHVAKYYCDKGYFEADSEEWRCSSLETPNLNSQYISPNQWSGKKPLCLKIGNLSKSCYSFLKSS